MMAFMGADLMVCWKKEVLAALAFRPPAARRQRLVALPLLRNSRDIDFAQVEWHPDPPDKR
jgi:hypothetical protein